tara:strand:- start:14463 stop:15494 length:1032 start_codon:yes stop_codon:yes gene_type:complete
VLYNSNDVEAFGRALFIAYGVPEDIAGDVVKSLVLSDLSGHPSHGTIRIIQYLDNVDTGRLDPSARPEIVSETAATTHINGNWGFGQIAGRVGVNTVVGKAKQNGVALAGLYNCNHLGRLGEWAEAAAAQGVLLLMGVGGPSSFAGAPFGGAERALATNPFAAGVPSGNRSPMIMDFATTATAEGKIRVAKAKGVELPSGQILDKHGKPSVIPDDFYSGGMMLPFGGHKGSALGILMDVLGSCLTGSAETDKEFKMGGTMIGINPGVFRGVGDYDRDSGELFERIESVEPAPGFDEVMLPGEPERRARSQNLERGVEIALSTVQTFVALAGELGVDASLFDTT